MFLPGAGAVGLDFALAADAVSKVTTTVIYDRGGTGWSDPLELPQRMEDVVSELRTVMRVCAASGPSILVGHALGGVYARFFAQRHPSDVAAMVLLDPAHEGHHRSLPEELPEFGSDFYRAMFGAAMERWPPMLRDTLVDAHASPEWLNAGILEASNLPALFQQMRRVGPLPDVPTTILTSTDVDDFTRAVLVGESDEMLEAEIKARHQLYSDLIAPLTLGEVRPVDSGQVTMPFVEAGAVAEAVIDAIAVVRGGGRPARPSR